MMITIRTIPNWTTVLEMSGRWPWQGKPAAEPHMGGTQAAGCSLRERTLHHGKIVLLGLAVVLIPVVVVSTAVQHALKLLSSAVSKISPGVAVAGGIGMALIVLLAILLACWFVGWLVSRTARGQLLLEWEKSKLLGRSPLQLQTRVEKVRSLQAGQAEPPPKIDPVPALALVAGNWQPGVIVEEQADGWNTVFLPDVPSVETGRLCLVEEDQIHRLDVSLESFRTQLTSSGQDSQDWLQALAAANPDAPSPAP